MQSGCRAEGDREEERQPSSLCEEVRQRNRLDRLRRACRQGLDHCH